MRIQPYNYSINSFNADMNQIERAECKSYFIGKMKSVPSEYRERLAERAVDNLMRYYSLLRSTGEEGIEDLISAIHASTFSTARCHRHHNYPSGVLEHSLGVYERMSRLAAAGRKVGINVKESDVILVALLHDVADGHSGAWRGFSGHGKRSASIVRKYLPNVSDKVVAAICNHMHCPIWGNALSKYIALSDSPDASTCGKGYIRLSDREKVKV